jgi:hypothetical protein
MKYCVVYGNPSDGLNLIGPFDTEYDAIEFADAEVKESYHTMPMQSPTEYKDS